MWNYEKRLEHPVNITNPNPELAKLIITQFGGPDCKKIG
jgi:spore coat protein JC